MHIGREEVRHLSRKEKKEEEYTFVYMKTKPELEIKDTDVKGENFYLEFSWLHG